MKYNCFIEYCKRQDCKPTHTTKFIQRYQQTNSGKGTYLHNAIIKGHIIYKIDGEPNQKWHLIESWYPSKKEQYSEENVTKWCGLNCPELLLWIAEVSGQCRKVEILVNKFLEDKEGIYKNNDRVARAAMVGEIKKEIFWDKIIEHINNN